MVWEVEKPPSRSVLGWGWTQTSFKQRAVAPAEPEFGTLGLSVAFTQQSWNRACVASSESPWALQESHRGKVSISFLQNLLEGAVGSQMPDSETLQRLWAISTLRTPLSLLSPSPRATWSTSPAEAAPGDTVPIGKRSFKQPAQPASLLGTKGHLCPHGGNACRALCSSCPSRCPARGSFAVPRCSQPCPHRRCPRGTWSAASSRWWRPWRARSGASTRNSCRGFTITSWAPCPQVRHCPRDREPWCPRGVPAVPFSSRSSPRRARGQQGEPALEGRVVTEERDNGNRD